MSLVAIVCIVVCFLAMLCSADDPSMALSFDTSKPLYHNENSLVTLTFSNVDFTLSTAVRFQPQLNSSDYSADAANNLQVWNFASFGLPMDTLSAATQGVVLSSSTGVYCTNSSGDIAGFLEFDGSSGFTFLILNETDWGVSNNYGQGQSSSFTCLFPRIINAFYPEVETFYVSLASRLSAADSYTYTNLYVPLSHPDKYLTYPQISFNSATFTNASITPGSAEAAVYSQTAVDFSFSLNNTGAVNFTWLDSTTFQTFANFNQQFQSFWCTSGSDKFRMYIEANLVTVLVTSIPSAAVQCQVFVNLSSRTLLNSRGKTTLQLSYDNFQLYQPLYYTPPPPTMSTTVTEAANQFSASITITTSDISTSSAPLYPGQQITIVLGEYFPAKSLSQLTPGSCTVNGNADFNFVQVDGQNVIFTVFNSSLLTDTLTGSIQCSLTFQGLAVNDYSNVDAHSTSIQFLINGVNAVDAQTGATTSQIVLEQPLTLSATSSFEYSEDHFTTYDYYDIILSPVVTDSWLTTPITLIKPQLIIAFEGAAGLFSGSTLSSMLSCQHTLPTSSQVQSLPLVWNSAYREWIADLSFLAGVELFQTQIRCSIEWDERQFLIAGKFARKSSYFDVILVDSASKNINGVPLVNWGGDVQLSTSAPWALQTPTDADVTSNVTQSYFHCIDAQYQVRPNTSFSSVTELTNTNQSLFDSEWTLFESVVSDVVKISLSNRVYLPASIASGSDFIDLNAADKFQTAILSKYNASNNELSNGGSSWNFGYDGLMNLALTTRFCWQSNEEMSSSLDDATINLEYTRRKAQTRDSDTLLQALDLNQGYGSISSSTFSAAWNTSCGWNSYLFLFSGTTTSWSAATQQLCPDYSVCSVDADCVNSYCSPILGICIPSNDIISVNQLPTVSWGMVPSDLSVSAVLGLQESASNAASSLSYAVALLATVVAFVSMMC